MKSLFLRASLLMLATASISLTGCKKDDDTTPAKSKTEILTTSGRKWKMTGYSVTVTSNGSTTPAVDLFNGPTSLFDDCDKDDFVIFKADKTVTFDEGADKCDAGALQTSSGTWALSADEKKMTIVEGSAGNTSTIEGDITELTDSTLKLSDSETVSGVTSTYTSTFTSF